MGSSKKNSRLEKRKQALERKKQKNMKIVVATIVLAVVFIGVAFIILTNGNSTNDGITQSAVSSGNEIRIPVAEISYDAQKYSQVVDDIEMRFFAVIGSDEQIHVALDACDQCYRAKKGYIQDNDDMKCINCDLTFAINSIGTDNTEGGCWPSYVPISYDGDEVVINIEDLAEKSYMFV
jgi:uncharacterized membrane protein